jgi:hypothetical protein
MVATPEGLGAFAPRLFGVACLPRFDTILSSRQHVIDNIPGVPVTKFHSTLNAPHEWFALIAISLEHIAGRRCEGMQFR